MLTHFGLPLLLASLLAAAPSTSAPPRQLVTAPPELGAKERSPKGIRAEDLVGVWEALDPRFMTVLVIDLHEQVYDSFVSIVAAEPFVFAVHSVVTKGHHVEILCDGRGSASNYSLKIAADGWAARGEGVLDANITLRDIDGNRTLSSWRTAVLGYHGRVVETLSDAKRQAASAIADAKKVSQGSK